MATYASKTMLLCFIYQGLRVESTISALKVFYKINEIWVEDHLTSEIAGAIFFVVVKPWRYVLSPDVCRGRRRSPLWEVDGFQVTISGLLGNE